MAARGLALRRGAATEQIAAAAGLALHAATAALPIAFYGGLRTASDVSGDHSLQPGCRCSLMLFLR